MKNFLLFFGVIGLCWILYHRIQPNKLDKHKELNALNFQGRLVILSKSIVNQGYGYNIIAEVKNISDKPIGYASANFNLYSSSGNILASQIGTCRNILPGNTSIIDSYFDNPSVKDFTYRIVINEVQ